MEIEELLLCAQEATSGPCPLPDESSAHPHCLFLHFYIVVTSTLVYLNKQIPFKFSV